jgi:N-acetylmuramoyl-L-alanine amidase
MKRYVLLSISRRHLSLVGMLILGILGLLAGALSGRSRSVDALALFEERVVVIDPGHGGWDPGASGNGGVEKHIVLEISHYLRGYLEVSGAEVAMTRETDTDMSPSGEGWRERSDLEARVALGNASGADVFLSIHCNAFPSPRWGGAQTFYVAGRHPLNEPLALSVQKALVEHTGRTTREASQKIDHYVLKNLEIPAVTVEVGFLSQPEEARLLQTEGYQRRVAWAIFMGLASFFRGSE